MNTRLRSRLSLDDAAWERLAARARVAGTRPDRLVLEDGAIPEPELLALLAECLGLRVAQGELAADPRFVGRVPIHFCRNKALIGVADLHFERSAKSDKSGKSDKPADAPASRDPRSPPEFRPVAVADPLDYGAIDDASRLLEAPVEPVLATRDQITAAINAGYADKGGLSAEVAAEMEPEAALREAAGLAERAERAGGPEDLLDVAGKAPVIKLVNMILFEAVKRRASDVHIQPYEDRVAVRFRIDGVLHEFFSPPKSLQDAVVSRIKVMARMNVAERRLAQDGRATAEIGERQIDLRVSSVPGSHGERVVLRLLDKSARRYDLEAIGMGPAALAAFAGLLDAAHGIILVTGPTGSGKSTTLYSALGRMNSRELNIITLEDPIEYQLAGISQIQVSEKKGMTFAGGLRSVLRQDPDVIMVGEIRDQETARMAVQSSLTGHLVFSTLHTNDSAGAVARMIDLGVEPYLVASSLIAVLAQRLVRRICPECREECPVSAADRELLGGLSREAEHLWRGRGCPECLHTGYRDRIGVFELLTVNDAVRGLVTAKSEAGAVKRAALASGLITLRRDGLGKALAGLTTVEEVGRTTPGDEV